MVEVMQVIIRKVRVGHNRKMFRSKIEDEANGRRLISAGKKTVSATLPQSLAHYMD